MIASGYTLDLYCDAEGCKNHQNRVWAARASFSDESKQEAIRDAKRAGWMIHWVLGMAYCPKCSKGKTK